MSSLTAGSLCCCDIAMKTLGLYCSFCREQIMFMKTMHEEKSTNVHFYFSYDRINLEMYCRKCLDGVKTKSTNIACDKCLRETISKNISHSKCLCKTTRIVNFVATRNEILLRDDHL